MALKLPPPAGDRELLQHISDLPHARANFKQLVRELAARGEDKDRLDELLTKLAARGELVETRSGQYVLTAKSREFATGRLRMHKDGYGFLISDRPLDWIQGDIYIPAESASKAMHGDRVIVRIARVDRDKRADGEIVRVLKRAHATVVGEFRIRRRGTFVVPHDDRIQQWIEIPEGMEMPDPASMRDRVGVKPLDIKSVEDLDGMIVNVEVLDFPDRQEKAVGRVIEVLGRPDDFGLDVEIVIRKHHIPHHFPDDVIAQAAQYPLELPADEIAAREDFRDFEIVTIDGETARDFDDAVWADRLPNGNFALHVHIADVSYYVRPGSPIDTEALLRGTSVYFPDRAVPMLPLELSTELCSLKPQVDRLVLSALLEIDNHGDIVSQEFVRGVIRSVERMTYTNVHLLLEGDAAMRDRYKTLVPRFELMQELAKILNRKRAKRGSIDFDMPEPLIEFDEWGEMVGVKRAPRNIAHRIIEEFMLSANEAVAGNLEAKGTPSIYRIHEQPNPQRVLEFEQVAAHFGYSLGIGSIPAKRYPVADRKRDGRKVRKDVVVLTGDMSISSRNYQKLVAKIEGKPEERILTYLMLRSLKQARYSEKNSGHFALAADSYTHFTSPIRRYPDLMVHRILTADIEKRASKWDDETLHGIAYECSESERRAAEAERELVEWKKTKFMIDRVGDQFSGLIISTTKFGFFVELEELFVEGLVLMDSLPGDRFRYNENSRKIVGERSRKEYSIGDRVKVSLDRVDEMEKKLVFSLVPVGRPSRGKSPRSKG